MAASHRTHARRFVAGALLGGVIAICATEPEAPLEHVCVAPFVAWTEVLDSGLEDQVQLAEDQGGLGASSCQVWGGIRLTLDF
jgi:hypothetical protein